MATTTAKRDHREERVLAEMARCKHFNGVQHDCCKVGVAYAAVRDKTVWPFGLPCIQPDVATCDKRELPTREEAEAHEARVMGRLRRIGTARRAIVEATGGKRGVSGFIACPNCEGGRLSYSVAGLNGHIWGNCSTPDCASWME